MANSSKAGSDDVAAVSVSITQTKTANKLQVAFEIMNELRQERAMYFTAGELLWIAADDRRVRFVDDEQALRYLTEVQALHERVMDRKLDWK